MTALIGLVTLTFWPLYRFTGFHVTNFRLPRPYHSQVR